MRRVFEHWLEKYFSDPQAILLIVLMLGFSLTLVYFGNTLLPVFVSIGCAYLLQGWINTLEKKFKLSHTLSYILVFTIFLSIFVTSLVLLVPLLWRQLVALITEFPGLVQSTKKLLMQLIDDNNFFLNSQHVEAIGNAIISEAQSLGKRLFSISLSSITGIISWALYLVLVPFLVFFLLKDKSLLVNWVKNLLPQQHDLFSKLWSEMDVQMGNYIRGKATEIVVVGVANYAIFWALGLHYPVLLSCLVGLSVVIPYVGATVITIPVLLIAYLQWGLIGGISGKFAMLALSYGIVQFLDGNILVPLLFSEAVNLHPIAIIVAILLFGSLGGVWGIFFAIPLATFIKAVLNAWPTYKNP